MLPSVTIEQILVFLIHFVLYYSSSRESSKMFISIFHCLSFKKIKAIPVLASEVEHTVRSTFLHVYAYLNVNWQIFVLKVAVMSLNGRGNLNYWSSLLINRNINRNKYMNLLCYVNICVTANVYMHTYRDTYIQTVVILRSI